MGYFDVSLELERTATIEDQRLLEVTAGDALAGMREFAQETEAQTFHLQGDLALRIVSVEPASGASQQARVTVCITGAAVFVRPDGSKERDAIPGGSGKESAVWVAAPSADGKWRVVTVGPAPSPAC